ncbi:MAG: polysaccharide biosynthesis tyrosine autokinase [Paludibacteraceae bacterium]|nr:polysaccharide biosynthesis tyrosine autokinase [Paludibacteraceae bacterium]
MNNKEQEENEFIDFSQFFELARKNWKWIVFSILFCLIIAFCFIKINAPSYSISAKILIKDDESNRMENFFSQMTATSFISKSDMETEDNIDIITSRSLLENMVRDLKLYISYRDTKPFISKSLYKDCPITLTCESSLPDTVKYSIRTVVSENNGKAKIEIYDERDNLCDTQENLVFPCTISSKFGELTYNLNSTLPESYEYEIMIHNISSIALDYQKALDVNVINKGSHIIMLKLKDIIPQRGIDVINKVIELYNADDIIYKSIKHKSMLEFTESRLNILENELSDVESNVEQYKKANNITDIDSQAELLISTSGEYEKQLLEIETQLGLVSFVEDYLKDEKQNHNLIPANLGISDKALVDQIIKYNETALLRQRTLQFSNMENPVLKQYETELENGKEAILKSISNIKASIEISRRSIKRKYDEYLSEIKGIPTKEKEYMEIKRLQQIKETLYVFLLQKREESAISLSITAPISRTIDKAASSLRPVSYSKKMILSIAFLLGLGIPLCIFALMVYFNDKIENRAELEKKLNKDIPFIGEICEYPSKEGDDRIVINSNNVIAEMFRIVRTNLSFMLVNNKKVILLTSTISGEGKTFNALNIAASFSLLDKKVALVGLDVRNPKVGTYLNISNKMGVTNYITDNTISEQDIIKESNVSPNLHIITSGTIPPNPSELLLSDRLAQLFDYLRKEYDYIFVDSAPIGVVTDTLLIQKYADLVVYVCKQNYSEKSYITYINKLNEEKKVDHLCVLLNGTSARKSGYGYSYGYHHKSKK